MRLLCFSPEAEPASKVCGFKQIDFVIVSEKEPLEKMYLTIVVDGVCRDPEIKTFGGPLVD